MAAPNSSPDLSVVAEQENASPEVQTKSAPAPAAVAADSTPSSTPTREGGRGGAPWWLVVAAAIAGLALFLVQFERAQRLETHVQSLRTELAEAGEQLTAYQSHLDTVRLSVGDLTTQIAGLKTLVEIDPLAPPVEELPAVSSGPPATEFIAPQAGLASEELAPIEPAPEAAPFVDRPLSGESLDIRDAALSTPFGSQSF
jgi:hypothetical protein